VSQLPYAVSFILFSSLEEKPAKTSKKKINKKEDITRKNSTPPTQISQEDFSKRKAVAGHFILISDAA
jgi:hypothetical protein